MDFSLISYKYNSEYQSEQCNGIEDYNNTKKKIS